MMNIGTTTKNWGAPQDQKLPVDKGNKLSAADIAAMGDKDIGTVLNEIADPNYIDPAKIQREKKPDLDKDAFFKLMLTQMKNQDPMNPMQSHEMAAHLAQFTSLEQMFNMNKHLEAIQSGQNPMKDYQALTFIGKEISADSSNIFRNADDQSHELRFNLAGDATEAKIKIKNEAGELVRELSMHDLKKGPNSLRWDGYNEQGQKQNEGEFKFTIDAETNSGKKVSADTNASGRITGVQFSKKGPMLLIGNQQVYLSDVKKIFEPKDAEAAPAAAPKAAPTLNPQQVLMLQQQMQQMQQRVPQVVPSQSQSQAPTPTPTNLMTKNPMPAPQPYNGTPVLKPQAKHAKAPTKGGQS